jgi:hypothetical protein
MLKLKRRIKFKQRRVPRTRRRREREPKREAKAHPENKASSKEELEKRATKSRQPYRADRNKLKATKSDYDKNVSVKVIIHIVELFIFKFKERLSYKGCT